MTEPPQRPNPKDLVALLQHDWKVALSYWTGIVVLGGTLIICWFDDDVGPGHPVFATLLAGWTLMLGSGLVAPAIRFLSPRWWHVPERERALHAILGVSVFGWLLDRSGWNRHAVYPAWGFSTITRTRLSLRALAARAGGGAHPPHSSWAIRGARLEFCCRVSSFICIRLCCNARSCFECSRCWKGTRRIRARHQTDPEVATRTELNVATGGGETRHRRRRRWRVVERLTS